MDFNEIRSYITCGDCRWYRAATGCCMYKPEPHRATDDVCPYFDLHPINGEGYGLTLAQCREFMATFRELERMRARCKGEGYFL